MEKRMWAFYYATSNGEVIVYKGMFRKPGRSKYWEKLQEKLSLPEVRAVGYKVINNEATI